jgi:hypothetical protein
MSIDKTNSWFDSELDEDSEIEVNFSEYDISASPNDFNIKTIFDFIKSGIVKIPGFQRNYVWDIKRASKLIESIIIGIPIPQIFLYEESKNKFLLIDGQQRLMTIYYFMKKRFPKKDMRVELRQIFFAEGDIPEEILHDNKFFADFNLSLPEQLPQRSNRLNKLNYSTLGEELQTTFELRTIRNIIIKQNFPKDDDSVVYEIFNRLNTGGVNLKPQEIRGSLYHSQFYDLLYRLNLSPNWRILTGQETPDINMKDIEILLRGFAMLMEYKTYKPSMTKFLNQFSKKSKLIQTENITYLGNLFDAFTKAIASVNDKALISKTGRFNISIFEAVFVACCEEASESKSVNVLVPTDASLTQLKEDSDFIQITQRDTASTSNVKGRIRIAKKILFNKVDESEVTSLK